MSETTADVEAKITAACQRITAMWPAVHQTAPSGSYAARPAPKTLYSRDFDDEATDDLPRLDVLVDLRNTVALTLNSWARILVEERSLTHALPDGHDAIGLARLIERHARWWSGHPAASDLTGDQVRGSGRGHCDAPTPTSRVT